MSALKFIIFVSSVCFAFYLANAALTEKQIESGKRMIMNICKPRTNVTDEELEDMKGGDFDNFSRHAMCFLNCALVTNRWQNKDNTFNLPAGLATLKMLPDQYQEEGKRVMEICSDSAKTLDDKCVAAKEIAHCFYSNSDALRKFLS